MKKQWMLLSLLAMALFVTYGVAQTSQQIPGPEQGGPGVSAPTNTDPGSTAPDGSRNPSTQNPAYPGDSAPVGKNPTATGTNSGYGDTDTSKGNQDTSSPQAKPNSDTASGDAKMSDSELQSAVRSKLSGDPAFSNVQATVENGKVTLDGSVASKEDKKRAKDEIKSVAGVRKVKEHLTVSGSDNTSKPTASGSGPGMAMLSQDGAAQSGGTSDQNTAGSTAGNSQTSANPNNQTPSATTPEAGSMGSGQTGAAPAQGNSAAAPQSDSAPTGVGDTLTLQRQVQSAIKNDPSLAQSSVTVNVTDTAIDLEGSVANDSAKTTAERIAQSYAINRKVTNNLQVTGRGNSDLSSGQSSMSNGTSNTPSSTGSSNSGSTGSTDQSAPQPK